MSFQRRKTGACARWLLMTVPILVVLVTGAVYTLLQTHWNIRISICTSAVPSRLDNGCNATSNDIRRTAIDHHKHTIKGTIGKLTGESSNDANTLGTAARKNYEAFHVNRVNESGIHLKKPSDVDCERRLPSCIIIGIQKCGTTALSEFLHVHPDIAIDSRQVYYFSQQFARGTDWYREQMPCSRPGQVTIERTPQYFYMYESPARIKQMNHKMKLIIIVRDPVKRAISNFAMSQYRLREHRSNSFERCVLDSSNGNVSVDPSSKYIRKSTYHTFAARWLEFFPLEQILVLDGEKFIIDPVSQLRKVEEFLGVHPHISPQHFTLNGQSGFNCVRVGGVGETVRCLPKGKGRIHPYKYDLIGNVVQWGQRVSEHTNEHDRLEPTCRVRSCVHLHADPTVNVEI